MEKVFVSHFHHNNPYINSFKEHSKKGPTYCRPKVLISVPDSNAFICIPEAFVYRVKELLFKRQVLALPAPTSRNFFLDVTPL
jgi:hypothetical protein